MNDPYASIGDLGKKKRLYAALLLIASSLCLSAILLLYFLHPRNATAFYCALAIIVLLLWICLAYYFLFYKLGHLKAIISFLKSKPKTLERGSFVFLKEEGQSYLRKLGFRKLVFLDDNKSEIAFLLLLEAKDSFKEGQTYKLSYDKDKIYGYEERNDEKE